MLSFIEILKAILFGIVEGITEWLPVISTGHILHRKILGQSGFNVGYDRGSFTRIFIKRLVVERI